MSGENHREMTVDELPAKFRPMSAWSYFWHTILFSIPVVGLVFLIIFALGGTGNVNKRSFARSYFCIYIVFAIVVLILLFTGSLAALSTALFH